jgi:hypothetical protein
LLGAAGHQSVGADQVNLSRDAFRVVVSFGDEPVAEERLATVAGDVDLMADVSARLGQVEKVQVIANTGSLLKSLVGRESESLPKLGVADEDKRCTSLGVHPNAEIPRSRNS